ncbi:MAG: hypothetical protein KA981_11690 [Bacteroidia bacterium]|jgi:hypothetical protein|nr:hypothetical protein [Bacteroidia bacterium]
MKLIKTIIAMSLLAILWVNSAYAQAPQGFNYQAVVRNSSGVILANQAINFRISLLQGTIKGASAYTETHAVTSDPNGLVNFVIGKGTVVSGLFNQIKWGNGPYFVKVELDPLGGTAFVVMSTTELMSVPYALYAEKSGGVNVFTYNKAFSENKIQVAQGQSWAGKYNLNYLCGDKDPIQFSNSALPVGMTILHTGSGKLLDFTDTLIVNTTESTPPGIHEITLVATSSNGTKAIQNLTLNIIALANTQGTYTYVDTLRIGPGYETPPLELNGIFTCNVSQLSNGQFSIFNFGKDSITLAATMTGRSTEIVYFDVAPQMVSTGCSLTGGGSIYKQSSFTFYYTKTCGTSVKYYTCYSSWW